MTAGDKVGKKYPHFNSSLKVNISNAVSSIKIRNSAEIVAQIDSKPVPIYKNAYHRP
jgi:hypothetical protein